MSRLLYDKGKLSIFRNLIGSPFPLQTIAQAQCLKKTLQPIPVFIKKFPIRYESRPEILDQIPYRMVKHGFHTSTFFKSENEVKKILSVPDSKFNLFNLISLSEVMHMIDNLENFTKFITGDDLKKLSKFTHEATKREFCLDNRLITRFWDFLKSCKDFDFTDEYVVDFLIMCLHTHHRINLEDVSKFMLDYDIQLTQEISELLISNFCWHGNREATEKVLASMKEANFKFTESIFSSLIILGGRERDYQAIWNLRLQMVAVHVKPSLLTQSALVVAYNFCKAYKDAKEVLEAVKKSDMKFRSDQYCDIVSSCVVSDVERSQEYAEHLQYILDSKECVAEYTDLKKVILELLHTPFAAEAIRVLSVTQKQQKRKSHLRIFIREIVRAKYEEPATVVELCDEIVRMDLNNNAFRVALEAALSENRINLSWCLLRTLKEKGASLKEQYFWPILVSKEENEDPVAHQTTVLTSMEELGVRPTFETLYKFVIPNLPFEDPQVALRILLKAGVSRNKAVTPLIAVLISNQKTELAIQLAKGSNAFISVEDLMEPLATAYLQKPKKTLQTLKALVQHNKKTAPFKTEPSKTGFGFQFVTRVMDLSKETTEEHRAELIEELRKIGIDCPELSANDSLPEVERNLEIEKTEHQNETIVPHPHEKMGSKELERHLVELKEKGMNTRGVLRRLLIKYSVVKDQDNCSRILEELKLSEGKLSPGMLSSALYSNVLAGNADEGLEKYWRIHAEFPTFLINSFTVVDLCSLLVRHQRSEEAMHVIRNYVKNTPKDFHHRKAILRNCHVLLLECVTVEGYDFTQEMCSLLVKEGLADVSPIIFGPLIKARLDRDDLVRAVEEAETLYSTYGVVPMRLEILVNLLSASIKKKKKGESNEHNQNAGDNDPAQLVERMLILIRKSRGLRQVNEDILAASLEIGDEAEAAAVFKNAEQSLRIERIRFLCNHLVKQEKTQPLLLLLSVSKSSSNVDRVYICECLINIYTIQRNSKAALDLWLQTQNEGLNLSNNFRKKLDRLLKATNPNSL